MPVPEPEVLHSQLDRLMAEFRAYIQTLGFSEDEIKEMFAKAERDAADA